MFINDRLLYLELHKSGCSHVLKILNSIPDFNGKIIGKHNTIYEVSKGQIGNLQSKLKVGNIRNPWDWYVSLWAFGSMKKGGLYEQLTNKRLANKIKNPKLFLRDSSEWRLSYGNADNPDLFKLWLKKLLQTNRNEIHEFKRVNKKAKLGLLTTRYLNLYNYDFQTKGKDCYTNEDFIAFDKDHNFIDFFLHNESLDSDIISLLHTLKIPEIVTNNFRDSTRTNSSKRNAYQDYYDDETKQIVQIMDHLIIQKHNYSF